MVNASNEALLEMAPALHRRHIQDPDCRMAQGVRQLCDALAADAPRPASSAKAVVVVVGARHVPGISRMLLEGTESTLPVCETD
mmetsp:Transcript_16310/g.28380  ORF Transcript_16310/g.28380 Transcript_16310/m.28380 type:complete len:84 (+) Transcript_16310:324-575(+)